MYGCVRTYVGRQKPSTSTLHLKFEYPGMTRCYEIKWAKKIFGVQEAHFWPVLAVPYIAAVLVTQHALRNGDV